MLTSKKACLKLGIHPNTLRKWAANGQIKYIRTPAKQRLYDIDDFLSKSSGRGKIVYCRVSSKNQKDDLCSQTKYMREQFPKHECIEDVGSGLNFKRKGFKTLLERIMSGSIEEVVVAYKDRLCRFGFELLEQVASKHNTKLVVLNKVELSPEDELVKDLLAIIHVFSRRLYGLRKYSKQIQKDPNLSQGRK
jgi:predicted site-specific integrase-resolvase